MKKLTCETQSSFLYIWSFYLIYVLCPNLLFCCREADEVMKWAFKRSARLLPSDMRSVLRESDGDPPVFIYTPPPMFASCPLGSVTAKICKGSSGMSTLNALKLERDALRFVEYTNIKPWTSSSLTVENINT